MSAEAGPPAGRPRPPQQGRGEPNLKPVFAGVALLALICLLAGYLLMPDDDEPAEGSYRRATMDLSKAGEVSEAKESAGHKCIWAIDQKTYYALAGECTCAGAMLPAGTQPVPPNCAGLARCTRTEGCTTPLDTQ